MAKTINNYQIISKIASGGMSEVYLAQDINTGTKVALKILDAKLSIDPEYLERFKKEASICKQLDHENIVKIISYGTFNESYYIAYEYIEGITLDKYIKKQSLTVSQIENISVQILKALSYAHTKNIIHRDIKPSNIIIEGQTVKILDFGIAKQQLAATVTKTGLFMGSPHYVSPEQIEGHDIDNRSDIYSFGIVLYEMIQGTVPFSADTPWGIIRAHLDKKEPEITKDVPAYLKEIVSKCLAKKRQDRFKSADDIIPVILNKEEIGKGTVIIERNELNNNKNFIYKEQHKKRKTLKAIFIPTGILVFLFLVIGLPIVTNQNSIKTNINNSVNNISKLEVLEIITPKLEVVKGETIKLSAKIESANQDLRYKWLAAKGNFSNDADSSPYWNAPYIPGTFSISVTVSDNYGNNSTKMIAIKVIESNKNISQEAVPTESSSQAADYENIRKQDLAEEGFLNKMNALLDEYNSVTNHINTYGGEKLIFGQSNAIEFEISVLTRYQELENKLRNFSCPSSYENDKNNLIIISESICFYQNEVINNEKNNDYNAYINNFYTLQNKIEALFNYTNEMVIIHNKKYH